MATTAPNHPIEEAAALQALQIFQARQYQMVTVNVEKDATTGRPIAYSTPSYLSVPVKTLCQITFQVINNGDFKEVRFLLPPLTFATPAPAFAIALSDEGRVCTILWSNLDPAHNTSSFDYRLRLLVDGQTVVHDPTVQNDPPPPVIFP